MVKISDINGWAEHAPKKYNLFNPVTDNYEDGKERGFNKCHDALSELTIEVDEEEIKKLISNLSWVNADERDRKFAKAISENLQKFLRIKK